MAGSGLKALMGNIDDFYSLDPIVQFQLFDSSMHPILDYGAEIWGVEKHDVLERVHLKFCKLVLGLPPSATTMAVLGELGALISGASVCSDEMLVTFTVGKQRERVKGTCRSGHPFIFLSGSTHACIL